MSTCLCPFHHSSEGAVTSLAPPDGWNEEDERWEQARRKPATEKGAAGAPDTASAPRCPACPPSLSSSLELNRKVRKRFIIQSLQSLCYKPSRKAGLRHALPGKVNTFVFFCHLCVLVWVRARTHMCVCVFLCWGKAGGGLYLCA